MEENEKTWIDDLKEEIDINIKPNNHKREITGAKLNTTLKEMVDELSEHTPKSLSELEGDTTHRTVTDDEKQTWGKSAAIFDEQQEYTDAERLQALANVSNQEAGYDSSEPPVFTGKMGYVVLQPETDNKTTFAAQIADKPNTIFEIRDVFDLDSNPVERTVLCDTAVEISSTTYYYANEAVVISRGHYVILPQGSILLNSTKTIVAYSFYGDKLFVDEGTYYIGTVVENDSLTVYDITPIQMPSNCVLKFNGGILKNGTLHLDDTDIEADNVKVFDNMYFGNKARKPFDRPEWYGYIDSDEADLTPYVDRIYQCFDSTTLVGRKYHVQTPLKICGNFFAEEAYIYLGSNGYLTTFNYTSIQGLNYSIISIKKVIGNGTTPYGFKFVNINSSVVTIKEINKFSDCCIWLYATKGIAYNRFNFGHVHDAVQTLMRVSLGLVSENSTSSGWVNANYFDSIRWSNGNSSNAPCMIWENQANTESVQYYSYYGNIFSDCTFEAINCNPLFKFQKFNGNSFLNMSIDRCSYPYINTPEYDTLDSCGNTFTTTNGSSINIVDNGKVKCSNIIQNKKACNYLVFDSGNLAKEAKLYSRENGYNFYCFDSIASIYYGFTSFYDTCPFSISEDSIDNTSGTNYALAIELDSSIFKTFGMRVSEGKHAIGVRYTKAKINGVSTDIGLGSSHEQTNKDLGAPIVNPIKQLSKSMVWNSDWHRFQMGSEQYGENTFIDRYFEFTIPSSVEKFWLTISLNSTSAHSIKDFQVFSTGPVAHTSFKLPERGTTVEIPATGQRYLGYSYYDEDRKRLLVWNGSEYTNPDGSRIFSVNRESLVSEININGNITFNDNIGYINEGMPFNATLTPETGEVLGDVVVKMGGVDISSTAYDFSTGEINIEIVTGNIDILTPYLTFTAESSGATIKIMKEGTGGPTLNLQTSTDGHTWTDVTVSDETTLGTLTNAGDHLMVRGNPSDPNSAFNNSTSNYWRFNLLVNAKVTGDITTLLNGVGGDIKLPNTCFSKAFFAPNGNGKYCYITTAPKLPSTIGGSNVYNSLFKGATHLVEAPIIKLTSLSNYACYEMFSGCSSLNYAKLLATSIGSSALTNWLKDVSASGSLYCDKSLTLTSTYAPPSGWTRYNLDGTAWADPNA